MRSILKYLSLTTLSIIVTFLLPINNVHAVSQNYPNNLHIKLKNIPSTFYRVTITFENPYDVFLNANFNADTPDINIKVPANVKALVINAGFNTEIIDLVQYNLSTTKPKNIDINYTFPKVRDNTPYSGYLTDKYGNIDPGSYIKFTIGTDPKPHYSYSDNQGRFTSYYPRTISSWVTCNSLNQCIDPNIGFIDQSLFDPRNIGTVINIPIPELPNAPQISNAIIPGKIFQGYLYLNAHLDKNGMSTALDFTTKTPSKGAYVEFLDSDNNQLAIAYASNKGFFSTIVPSNYKIINICNRDNQCYQNSGPWLSYNVIRAKTDPSNVPIPNASSRTSADLNGYIYLENNSSPQIITNPSSVKISLLDKDKKIINQTKSNSVGEFTLSINTNAKYLRVESTYATLDYIIPEGSISNYLKSGFNLPYLHLQVTSDQTSPTLDI